MSLHPPLFSLQGFSGCIGLAAGLALKKIGQLVALVIGLGFIAVQESGVGGGGNEEGCPYLQKGIVMIGGRGHLEEAVSTYP